MKRNALLHVKTSAKSTENLIGVYLMRRFYFRFVMTLLVVLSVYTTTMAQSKGFDTSRMNTSAEACTDFFEFANGTWLKNTPIPPAYSRWGSFNVLAENNR